MKKYMLKRILFSLFSLLVVVACVMVLVYSLIERSVIFQTDATWMKKNNNDRTVYEYSQYQRYGYLEYYSYTTYVAEKYKAIYGDAYSTQSDYLADKKAIANKDKYLENATVQEFLSQYEGNPRYTTVYMEPVKFKNNTYKPGGNEYLLVIYEKSVLTRLGKYLSGLFTVETVNDVKDETLTDRYVRFEKDPYSGLFAIVGSGTRHKYQLYFDDRFPWIHQNWLHLNLGVSYSVNRGTEITDYMTIPTGDLKEYDTQYPTQLGTDERVKTSIDFHSVTYNDSGSLSDLEKSQFTDNYTVYSYHRNGMSRIENSFVIGIISVVLAYLLGLPLGVLMARKKDKAVDKIGNGYIIFIMAVPSLAYIFLFATIGTTLFNLPYKFANADVKLLAYFLPIISLALPQAGSLMKWMRRYMIDQMNSDYVRFARAEGLSESEIFSKHIARNAFIPLVHGIPGSILGCLTGAIITERVYAVPGVGNLLTTAINMHDNGIIVATTVFYTTLSILSLILGDLLMAKYDPRISLSGEGGGGRK